MAVFKKWWKRQNEEAIRETRVAIFKTLSEAETIGNPYWKQKAPNEELVARGKEVVPYLIEAIHFEHASAALTNLAEIGHDAIPFLIEVMDDENIKRPVRRVLTIIAHKYPENLPQLPAQNLLNILKEDYSDQDMDIYEMQDKEDEQSDAISLLGLYHVQEALPYLVEKLKHHNYLCVCACSALAQLHDPSVIPALVAVLMDEDKFWVPRGAAAVALGKFGPLAKSALPDLNKALEFKDIESDEKWDARSKDAVINAIDQITNPNHESMLKGKGFKYEMWGI